MTRSWIPLALGALLLAPAAANAQEENVMVFAAPGRPRIGVMVDVNASDANNKLGATIKSVTPDGPAAKAGLEAGDIITKFGGSLARRRGSRPEARRSSRRHSRRGTP